MTSGVMVWATRCMMVSISDLALTGKEEDGHWEYSILDMRSLGFLLDVITSMNNGCHKGDANNVCYGISEEGSGYVVGIWISINYNEDDNNN